MSYTRIYRTALLITLIAGAGGIKDVRVSVPEAVAVGSTVTLHCRYDLETDILYSVKWYKGKHEFFRYIPKELPHTRVFPLDGVDVDIGRSGPAALVLRSVPINLSGRYRCEVSADAPSFHTAMKTSHMQVCDLPTGAPELSAERKRVAAGDTLKASCISPPSYPPANLTWFLNGNMVNATITTLLPVEDDFHNAALPRTTTTTTTSTLPPYYYYDSGGNGSYLWNNRGHDSIWLPELKLPAEDTTKRRRKSVLTMVVSQESLRQGSLSVMCNATVFSLYKAHAELTLTAEKPQIAPVVVLATGHTHSGGDYSTMDRLMTMVLLVILSKTVIR